MWWTDVIGWFSSPSGQRTVDLAILPAAAILVAGVIAALIGRASARSVIDHLERDAAANGVAGLVESARRASVWTDLTLAQQGSAAELAAEADIHLRLAPIRGGELAATWAGLRIESLRRQSVTLSRAPEEDLDAVRAALLDWLRHPGRAKRLFAASTEQLRRELGEQPSIDHPHRSADDDAPQHRFQAPAAPYEPPREAAHEPPREATPTTPPRQQPAIPEPAEGPATVIAPSFTRPSTPAAESTPEASGRVAGDSAHGRHGTGDLPKTGARAIRPAPTDEEIAAAQPPTEPVTVAQPAAEFRQAESSQAETRQSAPAQAPRAVRAIPSPAPLTAADLDQDLDEYDDEAQVTTDIPLRTPSPVSANAVRQRTRSGDEAVRRQ